MNQHSSAPGSSLLPDGTGAFTATHFVVIAVFAILVVIGIIWGARLKGKRKAAERDVREHNQEIAGTVPDVRSRETTADAPARPISAPVAAARDEAGGSLTQLKGLGPKVADHLAELGITTVGQIAALTDDDATRLDEQLGPFRGRMMRDRWVEQARFLAAGDRAGFESVFGRL